MYITAISLKVILSIFVVITSNGIVFLISLWKSSLCDFYTLIVIVFTSIKFISMATFLCGKLRDFYIKLIFSIRLILFFPLGFGSLFLPWLFWVGLPSSYWIVMVKVPCPRSHRKKQYFSIVNFHLWPYCVEANFFNVYIQTLWVF